MRAGTAGLTSRQLDSNQRPRDYSSTHYSPPLYQLSYSESYIYVPVYALPACVMPICVCVCRAKYYTRMSHLRGHCPMLDPGFEPGLPRPQRGVLTSRLIERELYIILAARVRVCGCIKIMELPGFDPGASRLQSARSSN